MKSTKQLIIDYMRTGQIITPLSALTMFGTMKLNARLSEIRREGHEVWDLWMTLPNGKRIKGHTLANGRRKF